MLYENAEFSLSNNYIEFLQKCLFLIGRVGKVPESEKLRKGDYTFLQSLIIVIG